MPDVVHWLGLKRIDRFRLHERHEARALTSQGVEIVERVPYSRRHDPCRRTCRDRGKSRRLLHPEPEQDPSNPVGRPLRKL